MPGASNKGTSTDISSNKFTYSYEKMAGKKEQSGKWGNLTLKSLFVSGLWVNKSSATLSTFGPKLKCFEACAL